MSFTGIIENCFDSHVHWLATGQSQMRLNLRSLSQVESIYSLKINPSHFCGSWLIGFGWDHNLWPEKQFPSRQILDKAFPDFPVAFSRVDGHALWVNTRALQEVGLWEKNIKGPPGGQIELGADGYPSGILIDLAMEAVFSKIPKPNLSQIKEALILGMQIFNKSGFTHIRDMTCDSPQWEVAYDLDQSGKMTLAVEQYFHANDPNNFQEVLDLISQAQNIKTQNLRVKGLKVFFDGALGSEGALLSQCYGGKSHRGLQIIPTALLQEIMYKTWKRNIELAVHTIGDAAIDLVVQTAIKVWEDLPYGVLHIEHGEIIRPETISLMRGKNIQCHLQPCHWLSDKVFLEEKLGSLVNHVFPLVELQKNQIFFDFGSDSPIESPSVEKNLLALQEIQKRQPEKFEVNGLRAQQHPDKNWAPNTYSQFVNGTCSEVFFRGKRVYSS